MPSNNNNTYIIKNIRRNGVSIEQIEGFEFRDVTGINLLSRSGVTFDVYRGDQKLESVQEQKGGRAKFWVEMEDGRLGLCKMYHKPYMRCGEVMMDHLLDLPTIKHAHYYPANVVFVFENGDAKEYNGVVSPDLIDDRGRYKEINAGSLGMDYIHKVFDNEHGRVIKYEHTVDFYMEALKYTGQFSKIELKEMRTDLCKIALLQCMFMMHDLHTRNIGFLRDTKTGRLELMPLYDYGSALYLGWDFDVVMNKKVHYELPATPTKRFNKAIDTQHTMAGFGVSTPLLSTENYNPALDGGDKKFLHKTSENRRIIVEEIAHELCTNPDLMAFYREIKEDVLDRFYVMQYNTDLMGRVIPYEFLELARLVYIDSVANIDNAVNREMKIHGVRQHTDISLLASDASGYGDGKNPERIEPIACANFDKELSSLQLGPPIMREQMVACNEVYEYAANLGKDLFDTNSSEVFEMEAVTEVNETGTPNFDNAPTTKYTAKSGKTNFSARDVALIRERYSQWLKSQSGEKDDKTSQPSFEWNEQGERIDGGEIYINNDNSSTTKQEDSYECQESLFK